jgi:hypothetical protein
MNAKLVRAALLSLSITALTTGCQPNYDGLKMKIVVGDGEALGDKITVEQGEAVLLKVRPESSNPFEDYEKFDLVELESFNDNIAGVFPGDDVDRFVVVGTGLGRTSIEVIVDGHSEDIIEAEVVAQEVSP